MTFLTLSNDLVSVTLAPEFGARVTSVIDLRSGRDWLVQGPCVGGPEDKAPFLGEEARGWDECFPTVAPCESPDWGRQLRDHGDIWGRPVDCVQSHDSILAIYRSTGHSFERRLTLENETLTMQYRVENTGKSAFPYLWSQHCLLATTPNDRLEIDGIGNMKVTGVLGSDNPAPDGFLWPYFDPLGTDLRKIQSVTAGWALKAYATIEDRVHARIIGTQGSIAFEWSSDQMPFLGLWLDYGGWPDVEPRHQIAIEPTTGAADDLANAIASGQARYVQPGSSQEWEISIRLSEKPYTETKS